MHARRALPLFLALVAASCGRSGSAPPMVGAAVSPATAGGSAATAELPAASRAMRITVELYVQVSDLDAAAQVVRKAAASHGGYLSEASVAGEPGQVRTATFEAKVPVAGLAAFRAEVAKLGQVTSESERAEDVTEARADIGARVRNAHAQEERLLALLAQRTGTLADVVAVERELGGVRESIERFEAQQRVLEGQIAYATVTVRLATRWREAPLGAWARIAAAGGEGVHAAGQLLVNLVVGTLAAGPSIVILAVIGYAVFLVVRVVARRRKKAAPAPE